MLFNHAFILFFFLAHWVTQGNLQTFGVCATYRRKNIIILVYPPPTPNTSQFFLLVFKEDECLFFPEKSLHENKGVYYNTANEEEFYSCIHLHTFTRPYSTLIRSLHTFFRPLQMESILMPLCKGPNSFLLVLFSFPYVYFFFNQDFTLSCLNLFLFVAT